MSYQLRSSSARLMTLCVAAALAACGGSGGSDPAPSTPTTPTTPTAPATAAGLLNWEGTQFADWNAGGALYSDDSGQVKSGSMGLVFAEDALVSKGGAKSLKLSGTSLPAKYSDEYVLEGRVKIKADGSAVDMTGKVFTAYFKGSAAITGYRLSLNDSGYNNCETGYALVGTADANGWVKVTFNPADTEQTKDGVGYCKTFDIKKTAFFGVRATTGTVSAAVEFNVDSISWTAPGETPVADPDRVVTDPVVPASDTAQLGWEDAQFSTWNTGGALYSDDSGTVKAGSMGLVFAEDLVVFKNGAKSLKVTGTSLEAKYSTEFVLLGRVKLNTAGTGVDMTGKVFTAYFKGNAAVTGYNLILNDTSYQSCKAGYTATSTADSSGWVKVSFNPADAAQIAAGYCAPGFDITNTAFFEVSATTGTASAAVEFNVDSIAWQ